MDIIHNILLKSKVWVDLTEKEIDDLLEFFACRMHQVSLGQLAVEMIVNEVAQKKDALVVLVLPVVNWPLIADSAPIHTGLPSCVLIVVFFLMGVVLRVRILCGERGEYGAELLEEKLNENNPTAIFCS